MADEDAAAPVLVDTRISEAKLNRELGYWSDCAEIYRRRGWRLLGREGLQVKLAFAGRIRVTGPAGQAVVPVITACIEVGFDNYDLWPPSVRFVDYFSGEPTHPPVQALHWQDGVAHNVLIRPMGAQFPFLCLPGVREYHRFHEHSGDDWLLHRGRGTGTLAWICEQVWQRMARNVVDVAVQVNRVPMSDGQALMASQARLMQADVDAVKAEFTRQLAAAGMSGDSRQIALPSDPRR